LLFAAAVARSPISVTLAAQNSPFNGACPATLRFAGTISGPANQPVTYVFNRTIKGIVVTSRPNKAAFDGSGHLSVVDSFQVDSSQAGSGQDELEVLPAGVKAAVPFSVSCSFQNAAPAAKTHFFIADATYSTSTPYRFDVSKCGETPDPARWISKVRADLRMAYAGEQAYLQEKDKYGVGGTVSLPYGYTGTACFHFIEVAGHYPDHMPAFYVTARHIKGGPMYCVTMLGGAVQPGEMHVSFAGGPILSPDACAALPGAGPIRQVIP